MRLSPSRIRELLETRELSLVAALREAGVSRTAYYSLARRSQLLPRTIRARAARLGVAAADLLETTPEQDAADAKLARARRICAENPGTDRQTVWHTLSLLELLPEERLERSLRRGRVRTLL